MNGKYFKFESFGTKDGDGVRGVIFLSGCPLRCIYCHNPESWQNYKNISSNELFEKVIRFKNYYKNGGVTFSGGEPLMQGEFLLDTIKLFKEQNINIAIDTSGNYFDEYTKNIIELSDLIILDLKFYDEASYKKYTLGSLKKFIKFINLCDNKKIYIRTVIIEGINDTLEILDKYIEILKDYKIAKYELIPFHTLGFTKYEDLNIINLLKDKKAYPLDKLKILQDYANNKLQL